MQLPSAMCPSIRTFRLQLLEFRISPSSRNLQFFIAGFLQALRMPHVEDIFISVDFQDAGGGETETESTELELLSAISAALLPNHLNDPLARRRLSSLNYKTKYNPRIAALKSPQSPLDEFPNIFTVTRTIPLDRVLTVSMLTLTTLARTRTFFTCGGQIAGGNGGSGGGPGGSGPASCRLRELRFIGCEDMMIEDLEFAVQSLRDSGVWDTTIERVAVEFCDSLAYAEVLGVVGKERLRYLI